MLIESGYQPKEKLVTVSALSYLCIKASHYPYYDVILGLQYFGAA